MIKSVDLLHLKKNHFTKILRFIKICFFILLREINTDITDWEWQFKSDLTCFVNLIYVLCVKRCYLDEKNINFDIA